MGCVAIGVRQGHLQGNRNNIMTTPPHSVLTHPSVIYDEHYMTHHDVT